MRTLANGCMWAWFSPALQLIPWRPLAVNTAPEALGWLCVPRYLFTPDTAISSGEHIPQLQGAHEEPSSVQRPQAIFNHCWTQEQLSHKALEPQDKHCMGSGLAARGPGMTTYQIHTHRVQGTKGHWLDIQADSNHSSQQTVETKIWVPAKQSIVLLNLPFSTSGFLQPAIWFCTAWPSLWALLCCHCSFRSASVKAPWLGSARQKEGAQNGTQSCFYLSFGALSLFWTCRPFWSQAPETTHVIRCQDQRF